MPLWITHTPVTVRGAAALSGWVVLSVAAVLCVVPAARADAPPCATIPNAPANGSATGVLARARDLAASGDYAHARGLLEWLLEWYPQDRDARLALARTDAWEHCYARAAERYRALIAEKPDDPEARAALIDLLLWQNQRAEAERLADDGLERAPQSADLWLRRARLYLRDDDPAHAVTAADRALVLSPHDPEIRKLRDSIYLTQLRLAVRVDAFSNGAYPNLYTAFLQLWQRIGRFELTAEASGQDRTGGALTRPIIDGLYTLGLSYHVAPILTFGGAFGFGEPAQSLPRWTGRVWAASQFAPQWSASLAYSLWRYGDDRTVHIIAPSLSFTPNDDWIFDLRWWLTCLVLGGDGGSASKWVNAIGVRALRVLTENLRLGASYTYGPQLDRGALTFDITSTNSHVFAVYADYRPQRSWGLQPYLGFEHRSTTVGAVLVYSAELAAYMRW